MECDEKEFKKITPKLTDIYTSEGFVSVKLNKKAYNYISKRLTNDLQVYKICYTRLIQDVKTIKTQFRELTTAYFKLYELLAQISSTFEQTEDIDSL